MDWKCGHCDKGAFWVLWKGCAAATDPNVEQFAKHMAADAKILDEDEETGAKRCRYVRTEEDHLSLAFTYAWLAAGNRCRPRATWITVPIRPRSGWSTRYCNGRRIPGAHPCRVGSVSVRAPALI